MRTFGAFVAVTFFVIETVITFRFGFLLANANPNNGFVDFIYDISGGLVDPFKGIVSTETVGDGVFEPASMVALVVYAAVALLLTLLLWAASSAPSASGDRAVTTRSRHRTREIQGE